MGGKLTRSRNERILLGVLGGIAEHIGVDPTLVRLIFVVLLVFNPVAMVLLYFLAALIIPEEGSGPVEGSLPDRLDTVIDETEDGLSRIFPDRDNSRVIALVLILLGALLLAGPFVRVLTPAIDFRTLTAVVLLVIGVILLTGGD
ncbi:PspC domain-containing protein [Thermococcus sp.]|uniref:PspC domain-containing protein n=1 Tax=Thermococcus sp. TaxID=35749 RepID=UPI0026242CE7|nr:PspC domain-containing protein [Thermococcus sp.]